MVEPKSWKKLYDGDYHEYYWLNTKTGATEWDKPSAYSQVTSLGAEHHPYHYNHLTGVTVLKKTS
jgi:hypothetical protein